MHRYDVAVIGAGIVGLAVAYRIGKRYPGKSIVVLEQDPGVVSRQSGANSGVIHSGLYYTPGSVRATTCRQGRSMLVEFCEAHNIPHRISGKLVVATTERAAAHIDGLVRRGHANGVDCDRVEPQEIAAIEPRAAGFGAIHVRDTGVVDFRKVGERLAARATARGAKVMTGARVTAARVEDHLVTLETTKGDVAAATFVACAGIDADRVARVFGTNPGIVTVTFRGEFFRARVEAEQLVRALIYSVPDPDDPFLGPHFTRRSDGSLEVGPVPHYAWSRTGRGFDAGEAFRRVTSPQFLSATLAHFHRAASIGWRFRSKRAFASQMRAMVPALTVADLTERRFAVGSRSIGRDGKVVQDYLFLDHPRGVHLLSAPSPAATASLAIADAVIDRLARVADWS